MEISTDYNLAYQVFLSVYSSLAVNARLRKPETQKRTDKVTPIPIRPEDRHKVFLSHDALGNLVGTRLILTRSKKLDLYI